MDNFDILRKQYFYQKFSWSTKQLIDNLEKSWKNYIITKRVNNIFLAIIIPIAAFLTFKNRNDGIYSIFTLLMALLAVTVIQLLTAPYTEAYKKSIEAVKVRINLNLCNCVNENNAKLGTGCNCHEEFVEFMKKEYKIKLY